MSTEKNLGDPPPEAPPLAQMKPAPPCWIALGEHRYTVDGDLVLIELCGSEYTMTEAIQLMAVVEAQQQQYGHYLLLVDLSRGIRISPLVRRRIADWAAKYRSICATACIGAGPATRAIMTLAIHATRLLGRGAHLMAFFSEMESGRRWLLDQRTELGQRGYSPPRSG